MKLFQKLVSYASREGDSGVQHFLGLCYYTGIGVNRDRKEAFKWFMKAAEQNHPKAQLFVGNCYANGIGVETPDKTEALKWYIKAAEQGEPVAVENVFTYYDKGIGMESPNKEEARKWFWWAYHRWGIAEKLGEVETHFILGKMSSDSKT